jgi:hypothetical protein
MAGFHQRKSNLVDSLVCKLFETIAAAVKGAKAKAILGLQSQLGFQSG